MRYCSGMGGRKRRDRRIRQEPTWPEFQHVERIKRQALELKRAEAELADTVRFARLQGLTWTAIGEAVGTSRQAATKRWGGEAS